MMKHPGVKKSERASLLFEVKPLKKNRTMIRDTMGWKLSFSGHKLRQPPRVYQTPVNFRQFLPYQQIIRATVPKLNLDSTFEQKSDIGKAVERDLEKIMSVYGYEIVETLIVDIEPDSHVKRAMNEINAAARLCDAANDKAEAEKILHIKRAEGEAESRFLAGVGIARQRQAIVDGLGDSVHDFSSSVPGTSSKEVMDMVLMTQYFDTMKELGEGSKSTSVFIPHGPGVVKDIATQIRNGVSRANTTNDHYGIDTV
ncbi:hypothetical protein IFM89_004958 [Coptis chinensis]|uniref:Band 7 domain-containing protein n=1 Tax=Coptis chinensis TaxID=261450 RepID=A0A835LTF7_9MAGN|nr:hypothetical protein IFM89_004958 [Coptis chinensis]